MSDSSALDLYYQAVGVIEGIVYQNEQQHWLLSVDGVDYPVIVNEPVRNRLVAKTSQLFRCYPNKFRGDVGFVLFAVLSDDSAQEFILRGCLIKKEKGLRLAIYRNPSSGKRFKTDATFLPLVWADAPKADGQYWSITAHLGTGAFVVQSADGPYDPPARQRRKGGKSSQSSSAPLPSYPAADCPLSIEEITAMATSTKIQLSCRISEVPKARQLDDGYLEFFLNDGSRILTVRLRPKSFKKLTNHGFETWVAAVNGTLGEVTKTGFMLEDASIQVFEKKAKPDKATQASVPDVAPTPKSPDPKPKGPKSQKRLLSDIRIG